MALGSTQPLTEMRTRNLPGGKKQPAHRADNLATFYEPNVWKRGSLNISNPKGLHGLYRDNFTFTCSLQISSHKQQPTCEGLLKYFHGVTDTKNLYENNTYSW
jgi:hypothetical protein